MPLPARDRSAKPRTQSPTKGNRRPGAWKRWSRRLALLAFLSLIAYHGLPRLLSIPPALLSPPALGPEITDRSGRPLRRLLENGQRVQSLRYSQIPPDLIDATVSAEDQRFWRHGGIDSIGLARASLDSLFAGRRVSGASTITQQLVKVASDRYNNRTWKDKVREMAYARKLEISWSKERILTEYLQRVNYGNQTTGCAAAAALYFKKPLGDLSLAECAFLAGLPQAPTRLNPYRNFEGAKRRQEWILSRMRDDAQITSREATRAAAEPLRLRRWTGGFEAPHFVDMLLAAHATDRHDAGQHLATATDHPDDQPSVEWRTTLDLELQHFCEQVVRRQLSRLRSQHAREAALVVLDNRTGGLRALVGSPDFFDASGGQVNGALAPRSAGSTLKPFTYLLALQQGDSPATIVDDLPIEYMTPTGLYSPHNYDRRQYGPMNYREALANSLNLSAVRVLQRIGGPDVLHSLLRDLGLSTINQPPDHYGLGLTIGNAEVRLLDLVNAYACLARLGEWRPVALRLEDEYASPPPPPDQTSHPSQNAIDRRLNPDACWLIADILSDAQARSRCFGLHSVLRLDFPAAVKTGTSTDFRDNWCVGYTPEFTVGVWVGNFDYRPMDRVSGVTGAAPIWREVMEWLATHCQATWLPRPHSVVDVEVDPLTGEQVPAEWRSRRPVISTPCARDSIPPVASLIRYDRMGRVILPRDYHTWIRGKDNWLGISEVTVGLEPGPGRDSELRITFPLAGTTLILDPDLPGGGRRLPLRANAPVPDPLWSSPSLEISQSESVAFAWLVPGRHEIRLQDRHSGATVTTTINVRSL
ncbi:MAG: penicillin-binding protein 1C [Verrucomicrobiales bacterium]